MMKKNNGVYYDPKYALKYRRPFMFCMGNRTAGKSFGWKNVVIKNFLDNKGTRTDCKFLILFRVVDTLKMAAPGFFNDVLEINYNEVIMTYKRKTNSFGEYFVNGESAGYAFCIKNFNALKNVADVQNVEFCLFDEFLPEDGKYIKGEVNAIRNIYTTCARGHGQFIRENFHIVFISNTVSFVNPYFKEFDEIKKSLKPDTKKIIRDDFYLEMVLNTNAVEALENTRFGRSIQGTKYGQYAMQNDFYADNNKFVEKVGGEKDYVYGFVMAGEKFGVFRNLKKGIYYISHSFDKNKTIFSFDNDDHDINYIMLMQSESYIKILDKMYRNDAVRFEDIECKMAFLTLTGIVKDSIM